MAFQTENWTGPANSGRRAMWFLFFMVACSLLAMMLLFGDLSGPSETGKTVSEKQEIEEPSVRWTFAESATAKAPQVPEGTGSENRHAPNQPPAEVSRGERSNVPRRPPQLDVIRPSSATVVKPQVATPPRRRIIELRPYQEWDVHETAMDSLGRMGEAAVPVLQRALGNTDPRRRAEAALLLARIGPSARDAVDDLVQALRDPDDGVRKAAARALGQIGPAAEDAVEPLMQLMNETPPRDAPASAENP